jgi:hypothetical protein
MSQSWVSHESVTSDFCGCDYRTPVGDEGVIFFQRHFKFTIRWVNWTYLNTFWGQTSDLKFWQILGWIPYFNPSREVLILMCCQSLVPSRSFSKEDFCRTCRNPAIRMVAWIAECENFLVPKKLACANSAHTTDWMVWYRQNWSLDKRTTWRD